MHGLMPRVALEKSRVGEIEQCGGGRETFRGARAEDLPRLVEQEQ